MIPCINNLTIFCVFQPRCLTRGCPDFPGWTQTCWAVSPVLLRERNWLTGSPGQRRRIHRPLVLPLLQLLYQFLLQLLQPVTSLLLPQMMMRSFLPPLKTRLRGYIPLSWSRTRLQTRRCLMFRSAPGRRLQMRVHFQGLNITARA